MVVRDAIANWQLLAYFTCVTTPSHQTNVHWLPRDGVPIPPSYLQHLANRLFVWCWALSCWVGLVITYPINLTCSLKLNTPLLRGSQRSLGRNDDLVLYQLVRLTSWRTKALDRLKLELQGRTLVASSSALNLALCFMGSSPLLRSIVSPLSTSFRCYTSWLTVSTFSSLVSRAPWC